MIEVLHDIAMAIVWFMAIVGAWFVIVGGAYVIRNGMSRRSSSFVATSRGKDGDIR